MEKIKLLALDMDGTTLRNDRTISDTDYNAIKKAIDSGIMVIPASGRNRHILPKEIMELDIHYAITKNGSEIYDVKADKVIYHTEVDYSLAAEMMRYLETKNARVSCEHEDQRYFSAHGLMNVEEILRNNHISEDNVIENLGDFLEEKQWGVDKIGVLCYDDETLWEIMDKQKDYLDLNIMRTGQTYVEINPRMASKGYCLKYLANMLGISAENIAAVGDSDNDLIMLCYAGYSFAMTNGSRFARETAKEITLSNEENGVAFAIEKILYRNRQLD